MLVLYQTIKYIKALSIAIVITGLLGCDGDDTTQNNGQPAYSSSIPYLLSDSGSYKIPFYSKIIPPNINLDNSFIVVGAKGSGKTTLWRWLKSKEKDTSISRGKVLIAEPFSDKTFFENALQEFDRNTRGVGGGVQDAIKERWSDKNMLNFVFSRIASDVLTNLTEKYHFEKENNLKPVLNIDALDEFQKETLFVLTCFYYYDYSTGADDNSKRFIDLAKSLGLIDETANESDNWYKEFPSNINNSDIYGKLRGLSKEIRVFNRGKNQKKLKLLSYVSQQIYMDPLQFFDEYKTEYIKEIDNFNLFKEYLRLLQKIGFSVKITVDGLDEVKWLGVRLVGGSSCIVDRGFLAVVHSLEELVDIAEDGNQYLKLFLFIPLCGDAEKTRIIQRCKNNQGKMNYYELHWTKESFSGYGNFLFELCKSKQKRLSYSYIFCKKNLPDTFAKFLGGSNCEKKFLDNVETPGAFNKLLSHFIAVLNPEDHTQYDFIGDSECSLVESAIENFHQGKEIIIGDSVHPEL